MADLILTTFDWVPEMPRGFVRVLRVRWTLEEAGLPYRVKGVPFRDRGPEHFLHQPFGQVPWLTDGEISIFESGAILLYLGERSEALMPSDPRGHEMEIAPRAPASVELDGVGVGVEGEDRRDPPVELHARDQTRADSNSATAGMISRENSSIDERTLSRSIAPPRLIRSIRFCQPIPTMRSILGRMRSGLPMSVRSALRICS